MAGARTALYAPAHRVGNKSNKTTFPSSLTAEVAPSVDCAGTAIQDSRFQWNLFNGVASVLGWYDTNVRTVNYVPSTIATAAISALANAVSGTPVTLAAAAGGITVLAAATVVWPAGATVPAGALVIDGAPAFISFGLDSLTGVYDPATMVGRALTITAAASAVGGDFAVVGYDAYGEAMTETITAAAGASTTAGKKAFKFVVSVTPLFSDAHNYSVGTSDVYGLPMLASSFYDLAINWNNGVITATTGFVAAVTTTPSATTGDVRGTYAVQSASDNTKRLVISQRPSLSTMKTLGINIGLFGKVQA